MDPSLAALQDWKYSVRIYISETMDKVQPSNPRNLTITGRLKSGKLHGLVTVEGVLSNDPKSKFCSYVRYDGLGFVGYFKNGIPTGVCWRELQGGAWIHGEVDKEGALTGKCSTH